MIEIRPLTHLNATVTIPGSKSVTHRALIVSALADGESVLINALQSEDTEYTRRGLETFGVEIFSEKNRLHVRGSGGLLKTGDRSIFAGNSGTSMRFLTALAALKNGCTLLDGDERMRKRPMAGLLEGLSALGIEAYSRNGDGCPPVRIESQGLRGGMAGIRGGESSQFLSALLMIAPYALEDVGLEVTGSLSSMPYIDITREVMSAFGVEVRSDGYPSFLVQRGQRYLSREYVVEGDASHASYFFSAAAITRGKVRVENFKTDSVQGDAGFPALLEKMGCHVARGDRWAEVSGKKLHGIEIDMNTVPDLVPTMAVTAAFARGKTVIKNIAHLRLKESDRISALTEDLSKMGIRVEEGKDWLAIQGGKAHGAEIETHNDHRLAMSFAVAGLAVPGIKIKEEQCVNKSFPGFWKEFQRLYL
ncbi:MAG: 3-phosphoshikimate 1-carboxyvinyltransferase [Deltaproteobacteria bacterium RBG_13_47_9]|nr:MAG: 3-phosphoshikimate 1-carboxyvinyltransferase [Deltaproteobacteria bacterium RBG_13_47_9]